jgi:hypothetical protein
MKTYRAVAGTAVGVPPPPPARAAAEPRPHSAPPPMNVAAGMPVSTPFIHCKGINVIPTPMAYSPDMRINATIVASIVVFNLAIVCHLKGLEAGGGPGSAATASARLNRAKLLYERSQRLLADALGYSLCFSRGSPVADMLTMASINNLALLHYETAQYDESKHYFDQLIQYTSTMSSSPSCRDDYVASMMDRIKSNFLLNAIILQNKPSLAPAA